MSDITQSEVPEITGLTTTGGLEFVPIDSIFPYDNNPRRIPQDAIDAVATSIQLYGWQQPIVVDKDRVIIVGHTRQLAARALGLDEVPIYVSDLPEEKVKEYRLVDNRTGEMSGWEHNALVMELREFDQGLLSQFFPEIDIEIATVQSATGPSEQELKWAEKQASEVKQATDVSQHLTGVECPSCLASFSVRTRSLPGMDTKTIEEIAGGTAV